MWEYTIKEDLNAGRHVNADKQVEIAQSRGNW